VKSCSKWWYESVSIVGGEIVRGYVPAPKPSCNCNETACERNPTSCAAGKAVGAGLLTYGLYRCARMVPSLFPALWWTIPANAAAP